LNLVRNYFGTSVPVAVVPEPGAGLLLVAGFLFFVSLRRAARRTGARIRVATVLTCYRQGMNVEEIVQQYPALKSADVHTALACACDHIDEIEAALANDDEAAVKGSQARGGGGP